MIAAFFDVDNTIVPGPSLERLFFRYLISKGVLKTRDIAGTLSFILRCSMDLSGMAMRSRRSYLIGKPVRWMNRGDRRKGLARWGVSVVSAIPE